MGGKYQPNNILGDAALKPEVEDNSVASIELLAEDGIGLLGGM